MGDGVEGVARVQFFKNDLKNHNEVLNKFYSQYIFVIGDSEVQEKEANRMQNDALAKACCSEGITPKSVTIALHKIVKYSHFWSFSDFNE